MSLVFLPALFLPQVKLLLRFRLSLLTRAGLACLLALRLLELQCLLRLRADPGSQLTAHLPLHPLGIDAMSFRYVRFDRWTEPQTAQF